MAPLNGNDMTTLELYPLLIEPVLQERVWGGRQLETRLGKTLPSQNPIGESWDVFWKNKIANGEFKGKTLGEVIKAFPEALVGQKQSDGEFPLLIKFLDAQDWLSVQVHPDDKLAAELEGEPRGKTECWYIIDAKPGAKLVYGFAEPMNAESFRQAIESGRAKDVMQYVEVFPGDFIYVPAGTMHAIGPGILIYELQQTSDTTYRVYDWDRMGLDGKPRELHLDKALKVTQFDVKPNAKTKYDHDENPNDLGEIMLQQVIKAQYFSLEKLTFNEADVALTMEDGGEGRASTISVIKGSVQLESDTFETVTLKLGDSAFLPAKLIAYDIVSLEASELLIAYPEG
jgi:mannose-6-phosphate isomerase